MFTGIVQGVARVHALADAPGLRTLTLQLPAGFTQGLAVGASVACDGVCLTATAVDATRERATFDVMQQTLALTTLGAWQAGSTLNVERAAAEGAEIGGHPLSGHIDTTAEVVTIRTPQNNHVLRLALEPRWMRYVFAKGYIALGGASLTVAEADRRAGWFEVWLIPETLRMTTFGRLRVGERVNVEIERNTQVFVDTVRDALDERLGTLVPALDALLRERGLSLDALAAPLPAAPAPSTLPPR